MEQELVVNKSVKINADISKVWNAFTDPEIVFVQGSILNIVPGMILQYTAFGPHGKLEDIPSNYTRVTLKLSPADGSTLLTVTQDNFGGDETRHSESNSG